MICSFNEIKNKEVIDIDNGEKLGFVDDIEIDTETSKVMSLVIYGRSGLFRLWSKESDIIIKCSEIKVIGRETILISMRKSDNKPEKIIFNADIPKKKQYIHKKLCK